MSYCPSIVKGRRFIRSNLSDHVSAPLWNILRRFNFAVAELSHGHVLCLFAFDNSYTPHGMWEDIVRLDAVSLGTYYTGDVKNSGSIDIMAVRHLYDQWDQPFMRDARTLPYMLCPTVKIGGPRPVQLPSRQIQEMNVAEPGVRVRPNAPVWEVPYIQAEHVIMSTDHRSFAFDYSKFPKMFYARVYGSDQDLHVLQDLCHNDGILCDEHVFTDDEYVASMSAPGSYSLMGRYMIITNMILDGHHVVAGHLAHELEALSKFFGEKTEWDNVD